MPDRLPGRGCQHLHHPGMHVRISIKAVPQTLLALAIMEIFENTRTLAVLMRYVGAAKKEERQAAVEQMIGLLR